MTRTLPTKILDELADIAITHIYKLENGAKASVAVTIRISPSENKIIIHPSSDVETMLVDWPNLRTVLENSTSHLIVDGSSPPKLIVVGEYESHIVTIETLSVCP